jgi:hypothetical protein
MDGGKKQATIQIVIRKEKIIDGSVVAYFGDRGGLLVQKSGTRNVLKLTTTLLCLAAGHF